MPVNCYHICTYCYANNSTKDDIHPTSAAPSVTVSPMLAPSSPLQWLPRCRRHRRHCHCCCHLPLPQLCRQLRRHHFRCYCYHFLVDCCLPLRCLSASATVAQPRRCRWWLPTPLPLCGRKWLPPAPSAAAAASVSTAVLFGDVQNIT